MPAFFDWTNQFGDDGFMCIFTNDADSMTNAENYLTQTVGFVAGTYVDYIGTPDPNVWAGGGPYGQDGYPTSVLIDRDGMIRQQDVGAIDMNYPPDMRFDDWSNAIQELTGGS
jgi:hypothetical protein